MFHFITKYFKKRRVLLPPLNQLTLAEYEAYLEHVFGFTSPKKGYSMRQVLDFTPRAAVIDFTVPANTLDLTVCPACGETLDFSQAEIVPTVQRIDLSGANARQVIDFARTIVANSTVNVSVNRPEPVPAVGDLRGFLRENRDRVKEIVVRLS